MLLLDFCCILYSVGTYTFVAYFQLGISEYSKYTLFLYFLIISKSIALFKEVNLYIQIHLIALFLRNLKMALILILYVHNVRNSLKMILLVVFLDPKVEILQKVRHRCAPTQSRRSTKSAPQVCKFFYNHS